MNDIENDVEFVERMIREWAAELVQRVEDYDRLFALARRGAAMNDAVKCQKDPEHQDRRYNVAERLFGDDH